MWKLELFPRSSKRNNHSAQNQNNDRTIGPQCIFIDDCCSNGCVSIGLSGGPCLQKILPKTDSNFYMRFVKMAECTRSVQSLFHLKNGTGASVLCYPQEMIANKTPVSCVEFWARFYYDTLCQFIPVIIEKLHARPTSISLMSRYTRSRQQFSTSEILTL